ncbi:MAG: enoyl-CoA hydratase-related protein [Bacteroidetes bacterium]|jgi:enoyl-CoA hydratase|nr:enoyl-CoA hydratase-related protein [Bacteroidota bacterium]
MSDFKILTTEIRNGIAVVTINRPEALNALNSLFFEEMDRLIEQLSQDPEICVMVITGEGKAFVAGADIAEMVSKTALEGTAFGRRGQQTFRSLELLPFPVIAAINGFALGGGLELAMACDFRIASAKAKFGQPEVNLGLTPGYAGTQRLPRLVGLGNALFLLTTAEMIDAREALRIGLVQKVVEHEELIDESMRLAALIAQKGSQAVKKVKLLTRKALETDLETGSLLESDHFGSLFGENSEGEEGMKAFLEKRKPKW